MEEELFSISDDYVADTYTGDYKEALEVSGLDADAFDEMLAEIDLGIRTFIESVDERYLIEREG